MPNTRIVRASNLANGNIIIGMEGGTSTVYLAMPSDQLAGHTYILTEHGSLYLGSDDDVNILSTAQEA